MGTIEHETWHKTVEKNWKDYKQTLSESNNGKTATGFDAIAFFEEGKIVPVYEEFTPSSYEELLKG